MITTTTFVTAFIDVYGDAPFDHRNVEWRYTHFRTLAESGIPLCVYVDPTTHGRMTALATEFPNIYVMPPRTLQQTWAHHIYTHLQTAAGGNTGIRPPAGAHPVKDTVDYLLLMHAKIEFVHNAIVLNPWNTDHFAWIDFSLPFLFRDVEACRTQLQRIAHIHYPPYTVSLGQRKCMYMCGCRGYSDADVAQLTINPPLDRAHWRFFGGIFVGHRTALVEFHDLCRDQFPRLLESYQTLVWEINYWAWLESIASVESVTPTWSAVRYTAEHNDTILSHFSEDVYASPPASQRLLDMSGAVSEVYDYIRHDHNIDIEPIFVPSSASYVYDPTRDTHWLLTRYVNYSQDAYGCYTVRDPHRHIRTRNVLSKLDPISMTPLDYIEVQDPTDVPINPAVTTAHNVYLGVEDVRIYMHGDDLRFIGTTFEYADGQCLRMLEGVIDTDSDTSLIKMIKARILDPPNWTYCEKNWAPIPSMAVPSMAVPSMAVPSMANANTESQSEIYFVYKWSPMQIGKVLVGTNTDLNVTLPNKLYIVQTHDISDPLFRRIKGSTTFTRCVCEPKVNVVEPLVGVVHFSIEGSPRKYYHMLLSLDPDTLRPLTYSTPFYFDKIGIEFCIGFAQIGSTYHFWISRVDRDPMHICLPVESLPLLWEVV